MLNPAITEADLEKIGAHLEQFEEDTRFLDDNREGWRLEHPDKWVVVFQRQLVGTGDTALKALNKAKGAGVPVHRVAIEYLASEPTKLILRGTGT